MHAKILAYDLTKVFERYKPNVELRKGIPMRRFVVLGGVGTIGRIVVRDLFESNGENHIVVADYRESAAWKFAESFNSPRVTAAFIDAHEPEKLKHTLRGQTVAINCLQHDFNLTVMQAALSAKIHYLDMGGLFSWTRKQLRLNKKFKDAGLTAILGMGCSPGITNVLAAYAVGKLGKVRSIKIRVGTADLSGQSGKELIFSYSAQTIVEELTLEPWIFSNGKFRKVAPRSGWELTEFPEPLGNIWTLWTRHSEIATLPLNFKKHGLRYCDFKVNFEPDFVKEVMRRLEAGWTITQFQGLVEAPAQPNDYEVAQVRADDFIVECHAVSKPEWRACAGDINTASPPSIVAQMVADGTIKKRGVLPPEIAVPIQPFFIELRKRGMEIEEFEL